MTGIHFSPLGLQPLQLPPAPVHMLVHNTKDAREITSTTEIASTQNSVRLTTTVRVSGSNFYININTFFFLTYRKREVSQERACLNVPSAGWLIRSMVFTLM